MTQTRRTILCMILVPAIAGCRDLVGNPPLPSGTQSPATYDNPAGAQAFARGTVELFATQLASYAIGSGLLTDELELNGRLGYADDTINARISVERTTPTPYSRTVAIYTGLQQVRGQARIARGALGKYVPTATAGRGEMYAIEAYADLMLAELFCSGVPLSTVDFGRDFTYKPSSTSAETYQSAVVLFDSALALVGDSIPLATLAKVGKARAQLELGDYVAATQTVAGTSVTSQYRIYTKFGQLNALTIDYFLNSAGVADGEGGNGLHYRTSGDPRTSASAVTVNLEPGVDVTAYFPDKYSQDDSSWVVVASGVEAQLIQAESALRAGQTAVWLDGINQLRENVVLLPDGVGPLPDLADPGTPAARVDTMFAERAAWLFLTGHREGDLRRLIRQYGRTQQTTYPTGVLARFGFYGTAINLAIPSEERTNPYFRGCLNRDA